MPALVCFGRQWNIGSDDFVFPGVLEVILRCVWLIVISVTLHVYKQAFDCSGGSSLWTYHIGLTTLISIGIIINVSMTIVSGMGSIMNDRPRQHMFIILYLKVAVGVIEIGWNCFGTYWAFRESSGCAKTVIIAVKSIVIFGWIVLIVGLIIVLVVINPIDRTKSDQSPRPDFTSSQTNQVLASFSTSAARVWEKRCRILCCCVGYDDNRINAFKNVAHIVSDYFHTVDLVPTDIAAGFLLIHKQQQLESLKLAVVQVDASGNNVPTHTVVINTGSQVVKESIPHNTDNLVSCTPDRDVIASTVPKDWMTIPLMAHYMKYATACYGWPMYLFQHICTGVCKLCSQYTCCACGNSGIIIDDNCCDCNTAAIKKTTGLTNDDLLYVSFHNKIYEIPFYVAFDRTNKNIVVAIRGTLSLKDALTDMTAECDRIQADCDTSGYAHKGILQAAIFIKQTLESQFIIEKALQLEPTYGLVITGHSLGAGAAALLAILLRPTYTHLKCFSFSPPGGLISAEIAELSREFVCAVVLGKDLVPRLSLPAMDHLKYKLLRTLQSCTIPKYKILLRGFCNSACGICPQQYEESSSTTQPLLRSARRIRSYSDTETDGEGARPQNSVRELLPPGQILHITRVHLKKKNPSFTAQWVNARYFDEILINPKMVTDHIPDAVLDALNTLVPKKFNPSIKYPEPTENVL